MFSEQEFGGRRPLISSGDDATDRFRWLKPYSQHYRCVISKQTTFSSSPNTFECEYITLKNI